MTAEFATVVPAVLLVLACCLGGLQLASTRIRLEDAAALAARSIARGVPVGTAASSARALVNGASIAVDHRGSLVCITARAQGGAGPLGAISVNSSSCALGEGR